MKINLPSKKIIALGIIALGAVGSVIVSKYLKNHPEIFGENENPAITKNVLSYDDTGSDPKSINSIDTDGDALKDWEELLWGTDSKNKDSDKDGTSDGEEIKQKRDPAKPGPNDFLSQYTVEGEADAKTEDKTPKNLNASDVFSQQLFSKYIALKNSGQEEDPESGSALVTNLTDQALSAFSFREYNASGLAVSETDKDSLRFYASSLALLYLDFLKKVQVAANSVKTDADLKNLSQTYADFAEKLYGIKIPGQIIREHLSLINNISTVSSVFSALAKYKENPVPAISALKAYQIAQADQRKSMAAIAEYLRKNDIIFTDGIEGNFWKNF